MSQPAADSTSISRDKVLFNWEEILKILGQANTDKNRQRMRKANKLFSGPIILPTKGGQPYVCTGGLLKWWAELEDRSREYAQKQRDKKETVGEGYQYGKEATVLPQIAGHVKKRRQPSRNLPNPGETSRKVR